MQTQVEQYSEKEIVHDRLMARSQGLKNDYALACILSTWSVGGGALPAYVGLDEKTLNELVLHHFPGAEWVAGLPVKNEADLERNDERDELLKLIQLHRAGQDISEEWIAHIIAAACMGGNHLWQDLGLWSRKDLSELMQCNFPSLAAKNDRDMKWKKFLYKQLCIQEGIYTCRAPSCEVCVDYQKCFGPED